MTKDINIDNDNDIDNHARMLKHFCKGHRRGHVSESCVFVL